MRQRGIVIAALISAGLAALPHSSSACPTAEPYCIQESPEAVEVSANAARRAALEHGEGSEQHRAALSEHANALQDAGRSTEEVVVRREVLAAVDADPGATVRERVRARGNLGIALSLSGELDEAISLLRAADTLEESDRSDPDPWVGLRVEALASALERSGQLDQALEAAERAVALCEERLAPSEERRWIPDRRLQEILLARGDFERCAELALSSLATRSTALGEAHPLTCEQRERACYVLGLSGQLEAAVAIAEEGVRTLRERLEDDDSRLLAAIMTCADARSKLGDLDGQIRWLEQGVGFHANDVGPDASSTVLARSDLAHVLFRAGRTDEAEELFEGARAALVENAWSDPMLRMSIYSGIARTSESRARYSRALEFGRLAYEAAVEAEGPNSLLAAIMLQNVALSESWLGRPVESRRRFEEAIAVFEGLGPQHAAATAIARSNLATLLESMGLVDDAFAAYEASLGVLDRSFGPASPWTSSVRGNLGLLLLASERYAEARPHLEEVLRLRVETLDPEHPDLATSHLSLAVLSDFEGDLESARASYARAREISAASRGERHPETLNIDVNIARFERMTGAFEVALERLEGAHSAMQRELGPDHPYTVQARVEQLAALLAMEAWDEAASMATQALAESGRLAQRNRGAMSEGERLSSIETQRELVDLLIAVATRTGREDHRRRAYDALLTWKGAIARDQLFSREALFESLDDEGRTVLRRLQAVQGELSQRLYAYDAGEERSIDALREERSRLERALVADTRPATTPTGSEVVAALDDGDVLIDFMIHRPPSTRAVRRQGMSLEDPWDATRVIAFLVPAAGTAPKLVDLGPSAALEDAVERFLFELRGSRGIEREDPDVDAGDALRELLWAPLEADVGAARTVIVSPMGFLARLPFETVETARGFLLELHRFVYLQDAASLLDVTTDEELGDPTFLAVGAVDFRSREEAGDGDEEVATRRAARPRRWSPLPATEDEVRTLAEIHAEAFGAEGATLLTGGAASEGRVREAMGDAAFIHLATHGFFTPGGPPSLWRRSRDDNGRSRMELGAAEARLLVVHPGLLSGLALAGANARRISEIDGARDDGYLTAEEVAWLPMSARLVVLSACETGLGKDAAGEGLIGLRRAFRLAGARTVISSLWSVDDRATADLMTVFYERLWLDGATPLDALREARIAVLEDNLRNHGEARPATWGAFVLSGAFR